MNGDWQAKRERLAELVLARALHGLPPEQDAEAQHLATMLGMPDDGSFERAAAAATTANLRLPLEPMPAHLRARLEGQLGGGAPGPAAFRQAAAPAGRRSAARSFALVAGWVAAAACLVVAIWALRGRRAAPVANHDTAPSASLTAPAPAPPHEPTPAEARAELLASAKDAVRVAWKPAKDVSGAHASGDVVWSAAEQRGYMRFEGLAANDPGVSQYQLWIFDKGRDARYPVDGGVFDVAPGRTEVVVPISAKLRVGEPTLFAVTVEKPGGVVVSDRKRIAVVASPG